MTKKRTIKINNALTGKPREVVLPARPTAKKKPEQQTPEQTTQRGGNGGKNKL